MKIKEEHMRLLNGIGLKAEDMELFDGKLVGYEYDDKKGVRLYDPLYQTSYDEYIGIDGWSAWSSEDDSFMSDLMRASEKGLRDIEKKEVPEGEIEGALKKKFSPSSEDPE